MNGWGIHGVEGMSRVSWDHLTFQHFQPPWDPPPGPSTIPSPWVTPGSLDTLGPSGTPEVCPLWDP